MTRLIDIATIEFTQVFTLPIKLPRNTELPKFSIGDRIATDDLEKGIVMGLELQSDHWLYTICLDNTNQGETHKYREFHLDKVTVLK